MKKTILKLRKALHICLYFLLEHHKYIAKLKSYGLMNIRTYRIKFWYRDLWTPRKNWADSYIKKYYATELKGKKCFAKTMTRGIVAQREIFINSYITKCNLDFVPKLLLSDENYDTSISLMVIEFIEGLREFTLPKDETTFEAVCAEFEHIHKCLRVADIIHGDLCRYNLLLDENNHIFLIDFGLTWVPGSENYPIDYRRHRGASYIDAGCSRIYDNAYSFLNMLDTCGISNTFKQKECYKRIQGLMGTHTYTVTL